MIDETRDRKKTYRVVADNTHPLEYDISTWYYYGAGYSGQLGTPPSPQNHKQRADTMPAWVIEGMKVLDVPGEDVVVPFFGNKLDGVYWFWADMYYITAGYKKGDDTNTKPLQVHQQLTLSLK